MHIIRHSILQTWKINYFQPLVLLHVSLNYPQLQMNNDISWCPEPMSQQYSRRMAQETQPGALCQPKGVGWGRRWQGGSKGTGHMYTYGWFRWRLDRKQQNSVKQLSFNKKQKNNTAKNTIEILIDKVTFLLASPLSHRSLNTISLSSHTLTPQNVQEK